MGICSEHVIPVEQIFYGFQPEPAPSVTEEISPGSRGVASELRLQYLELLAKLGIPLVMEGSPAEAFLVR